MAITINQANNTISGISVGGLPDGCIDSDCFADATIQESDCVNGLVSGSICNAATFYNSTKTTFSWGSGGLSSPAQYLDFNYTKLRADSDLHIICTLTTMGGSGAGANSVEWVLTKGSSTHTTPTASGALNHGNGYTSSSGVNMCTASTVVDSSNCNEAGEWNIKFRNHNYGSDTAGPAFTIMNPNSSNDARLSQQSSCMMIFEYLPTT